MIKNSTTAVLIYLFVCGTSFLCAEYKNRQDSFFDVSLKSHYDKGFFLNYDFGFSVFDFGKLYRGFTYSYIAKKRVLERKAGPMFSLKGYYARMLKYSPYEYNEEQFLAPFNFDASLYINTGKFTKGVGNVQPFFGLGIGLLFRSMLDANEKVKYTGISGNVHLGTDFMVLPPSFAIRLQLTALGGYVRKGTIIKFFSSSKDEFILRTMLQVGLVVYVK